MAKLRTRNAFEQARFEKVTQTGVRVTLVMRSDGKVLKKFTTTNYKGHFTVEPYYTKMRESMKDYLFTLRLQETGYKKEGA